MTVLPYTYYDLSGHVYYTILHYLRLIGENSVVSCETYKRIVLGGQPRADAPESLVDEIAAWTKGIVSCDARNSSTSDSENVQSIDCFMGTCPNTPLMSQCP